MYKIKQNMYFYVIMETLPCAKLTKNSVLMSEFTHYIEIGICVLLV